MDVRIGNIHSGATPPWLRGDGDEDTASSSVSGGDSSAVTFGPSLDEFIKHSRSNLILLISNWQGPILFGILITVFLLKIRPF